MTTTTVLESLILSLPSLKEHHSRQSETYKVLEKIAKVEVERLFNDASETKQPFYPFGKLALPYFKMGAISSLDLFGLDELIIFSFYWVNRDRYKKVLDIGANIGLHSTLMSKCGFDVELFEPDPHHFGQLQKVLKLNDVNTVKANQAAISTKEGVAEFVRVLGNTTSSHLAGSKQPYGELERFKVSVLNFRDFIGKVDLIKMDVEGHESELIKATSHADWLHLDAIIEVGTQQRAQEIFEHLNNEHVNMFAQKSGWNLVTSIEEMPCSCHEGSLFISIKQEMPWN